MIRLTPEQLRDDVRQLENLEISYAELLETTGGDVEAADATLATFVAESSDTTIESLCWYLREQGGMAEACAAETKRIAEVKARAEARALWAKDQIRAILLRRGDRRAEVGTFTIGMRTGSQSVVATEEIFPGMLPERFQRMKVEIDKGAIGKALKANEAVEGFKLQRGPDSLVIK